MICRSKLDRISELNETIRKAYVELNSLKSEVVKEMVLNDVKSIDLSDKEEITLKWVIEKEIDYERLQKLYPDVYLFGLRQTFSAKQALNCVKKDLLHKIIKDCVLINAEYKAKVGRKK